MDNYCKLTAKAVNLYVTVTSHSSGPLTTDVGDNSDKADETEVVSARSSSSFVPFT